VTPHDRQASLQEAAALIRSSANYRWVGLYDVDHAAGLVRNVSWSGPGAPEHPTFPLNQGLTSAAVAQRQIVNVGDVSADPRYLTAFGTPAPKLSFPSSTRPEIVSSEQSMSRVKNPMPSPRISRIFLRPVPR
jgi:putative methionine-R-sulfoxide reductase with GAF domain